MARGTEKLFALLWASFLISDFFRSGVYLCEKKLPTNKPPTDKNKRKGKGVELMNIKSHDGLESYKNI